MVQLLVLAGKRDACENTWTYDSIMTPCRFLFICDWFACRTSETLCDIMCLCFDILQTKVFNSYSRITHSEFVLTLMMISIIRTCSARSPTWPTWSFLHQSPHISELGTDCLFVFAFDTIWLCIHSWFFSKITVQVCIYFIYVYNIVIYGVYQLHEWFCDQKLGLQKWNLMEFFPPIGGNSRKISALKPSESSDVDFAYMDADVKFWGRPAFFFDKIHVVFVFFG